MLARLVLPVLLALLVTSCSSDSETPDPTTSSSTSGSATETSEGGTASCLFTVEDVSSALGGSWEREAQEGEPCGYTNEAGAAFVTELVDQAAGPGLRKARESCLDGIRPIAVGDGFVCVDRQQAGDLVVGNIPVDDQLWVVVIVPSSEGVPEPELQAMAALLDLLVA